MIETKKTPDDEKGGIGVQRIGKRVLCAVAACMCLQFCGSGYAMAYSETEAEGKGGGKMAEQARVASSAQKYKALMGDARLGIEQTDPDFSNTMQRFMFGDVYQQGNLSDRQRALISLAVLATVQEQELLRQHVGAALNAGATPVEIKEAMYQCAPYIGFPKTLQALRTVNAALQEKGVELPLENQTTVNEESRFAEGLKVQKQIFGPVIDQLHANAPKNQKHIQNYLSAFCFGDTYTRRGLDLKMRELLTLSVIVSLGGCESQVKAHVQGNVSVGNDKETLLSAVTQCLPYIGFPRTLNALACINELLPEPQKG